MSMPFSSLPRNIAEPGPAAPRPSGSEDCLRDLLELACRAARLGIFERDLRTGIGSWNQELFNIRGVVGDCCTPPFEDAASRVFATDRPHFDAAMRGSLLPRQDPVRRQAFRLRYRVHADDGSLRYLHKQWVVRYGADGRAESMVGVVVDDTPYQDLLRSHDAAAAQIDLAAAFANLALWRQDITTGEVRLNARAAELFNVDVRATTIPLLRMRMTMHPDDRPIAEAADARALETGRPVDVEWRQRTGPGIWRRLLTRRGAHRDVHGEPVMLIGVAMDADAPVAQSESPDDARCPAPAVGREADARARFLARISHELRTPTNAVLAFAQLLSYEDAAAAGEAGEAGGAGAPRARRPVVAHIVEAGQQLMALIDDVLDLARLEGGELQLRLQPVALEPVAASALAMLEAPLRKRRLRVTARGLAVAVLGDAGRLRQVLLNLIGNAVRHGAVGGAVDLDAELQADGVRVRVTDDGPGISPDQLCHLFEPFNRSGGEPSGLAGSGLGLAITKALVDRMGGSIHVSSTPGAGSVFELMLLAAPPAGTAAS